MADLNYRYQIQTAAMTWVDLGNKVLDASWKIGKDTPNSLTVLGMDTDAAITVYAEDLTDLSPYTATGANAYAPGKRIRIQCKLPTESTWTDMWNGRLYDLQFHQTPYTPDTFIFFCVGELQWLNSDQFHRHFNYRGTYAKTHQVILSILGQAGYTGGGSFQNGIADIAIGSLLLSDLTGNVYERVSVIDVLEALVRAELGMLYDRRDGGVQFENRNWRTSRKRHTIPTDKWFVYGSQAGNKLKSIANSGSYTDSIYNIFSAEIRQVFTGQVETVLVRYNYEDNRTLLMAPMTEVVERVVLPQGRIEEVAYWNNPAFRVNYRANSKRNGKGIDRTSALTVTIRNRSNTQAEYYIQNNSPYPVYITYLDFMGAPFTINQSYTLTRQDNDSIMKYGERPYLWPSNLLRDAEAALPHVEWLLSVYSEPIPLIEMELPGNKYPSVVLDTEVSDLIRYRSDKHGLVDRFGSYRIGIIDSEVHQVSHNTDEHIVTYKVSDMEKIYGAFTRNSKWGIDTRWYV